MAVLKVDRSDAFTHRPEVKDLSIDAASTASDLNTRIDIVVSIVADNVASVDRDARFPEEEITAARAQRLLGITVPRSFGREGASLSDVVDICYGLGRARSSMAMIYAMHQIMVTCLIRHRGTAAWYEQ
jgi:acyl-CoA dehydrogenase